MKALRARRSTSNTDDKEWMHSAGDAMARVLAHAARALAATPNPEAAQRLIRLSPRDA
jgi:hypothetical protein